MQANRQTHDKHTYMHTEKHADGDRNTLHQIRWYSSNNLAATRSCMET